jgi:hypothetical protein
MGTSRWSDDFYSAREAERAKTGTSAFHYTEAINKGEEIRQVHATMNPQGVTRESRDSDEHPDSNSVAVIFDVTGSMHTVPVLLQKKLPKLMGTLGRKNYLPHPQVLFGAVGDYYNDKGPVQIGQYESGIEMDDDLGRFWLEGGGGGTGEESYELALYFFARHTSIDCFEKRGRKGYLFIVGDEKPYPRVDRQAVKRIFGDDIQEDIPIEQIIAECREKYHVFFLLPKGTSHWNSTPTHARWIQLLGEDYFRLLEDPDTVCETISVIIGMTEGTVNLDQAKEHLREAGTSEAALNHVTNAVQSLARQGKAPSEGNVRL